LVHGAWAHNTIVELVLIGLAGSQQIINVHAFEASAAHEALNPSDAAIDTSAQALRDDWITNCITTYRAIHGPAWSLTTVGSQVVERPTLVSHRLGRQDRTNAPMPAAGTGSSLGGDLPYSDAVVLRWRSLVASRHARGRTYFGGLGSEARSLGPPLVVSAAEIAAMNAYGAAMLARYRPGGAYPDWNLTIYSRPYDNPHGDYAKRVGGALVVVSKPDYTGNSNFITSYQPDTVLRVQRRREVGVGS
jgi:hypothetical protein